MILRDIRVYMMANRRAALHDLSLHFKTDPDALRAMLQTWIAKGKLAKLPTGTVCSDGCCKCDPATLEIYEWVDRR